MAQLKRSNSMTARRNAGQSFVAEIYNEFLRSRKNKCAQPTYNIYKDLGERIFIPSLVRTTGDDLFSVTANDLRTIIENYQDEHTKGGVAFIYRHLKCFINWFWKEYNLHGPSPMKTVEIKKPKNKPLPGIDRESVNKLLETAKKRSTFPERDVAMLMILCDTGIRRTSLMNLKMGDIDLTHAQMTVFEKDQDYHTKTFGAATEKAIRNYLDCLEDIKPTDPFWIKLDGCALSMFGAKEILRRLCSEAEIEPYSFHDFRRFYALETYLATHDIYFVSRALDHKSVEVTKRYLDLDKLQDFDKLRAVSPMDKQTGQTGIKVNRKRAYA